MNAHIDDKRPVPLWAALGAPLVGIPLMVAILAVAAPSNATGTVEPEAGSQTEQMEASVADWAVDSGADCEELPLKRG
jgi:hypothetical protein